MKKIGFAIMLISLVLGFIQERFLEDYLYDDYRQLVIFLLWASFLTGLHIIIQENEKDGIKPRK